MTTALQRLAMLVLLLSLSGLAACEPASEDIPPTPVLAKSCQEACTSNADCNVDFACVSKRCTYAGAVEMPLCTDDDSCTPIKSGWLDLAPCNAQNLCNFGECVVIAGQENGRCVMPPPCVGRNQELQWPSVEGGDVTVCGQVDYSCRAGTCWKPCVAADCSGTQPICGDDGDCHCEATSCGGSASGEVCLDSGRCGCTGDSDCGNAFADTCYDGVCGCGSVSVCTAETLHSGTQWVCE